MTDSKRSTFVARGDAFTVAGKFALTGMILYVAWGFFAIYRTSAETMREIRPYAANSIEDIARDLRTDTTRGSDAPWPAYPGATLSRTRPAHLNDMTMLSDAIEVRGTPSEVVNYYRKAMIVRGWRDTTEASFGMNPKALNCAGVSDNLQNEEYLRRYDSIRSNYLVLQRGDQTVQIRTAPVNGKERRTHVLLTYMKNGNYQSFALDLAKKVKRAEKSHTPKGVWETREVIGKDLYETQMFVSRQSPEQASAAIIEQLKQQGWRPVVTSGATKQKKGMPNFTYLANGSEFALLTVRKKSGSRSGSTAALMTVVGAPGGR